MWNSFVFMASFHKTIVSINFFVLIIVILFLIIIIAC